MVDPNRKINRLTDKDIEFLEDCEREFSSRFTEEDDEFMEHCVKPLDDPPIIENWNTGGGDFSRNDRGGRYHNRGGSDRSWRNNFSNRRGGRDNFKDRHGSSDGSYINKRPAFCHKDSNTSNRPPMKVRRDYKNFVAASKDDLK